MIIRKFEDVFIIDDEEKLRCYYKIINSWGRLRFFLEITTERKIFITSVHHMRSRTTQEDIKYILLLDNDEFEKLKDFMEDDDYKNFYRTLYQMIKQKLSELMVEKI